MKNYPKIVVSVWPGLGDVIFITPVFKTLRKKFPNAHITALVWSSGGIELLRHNPYIDEFIEGSFKRIIPLVSKLKGYDIGIQCSQPVQFLFLLAGIKRRVSFNGNPFWWFYPAGSNNFHSTEHYLQAIDNIDGIKLRDNDNWEIFLENEELEVAKSILKGISLPLVAIHPGGRNNKCKRWGIHKFAVLCNLLKDKFNANIVLVGGKQDIKLCSHIEKHTVAETLNLAGKLKLRETAAILKHCDLFVGNASGPTYIASVLGTSVVGVFGPDNPNNFGPRGKNVRVVTPKFRCAPCLHFYRNFFWGMRVRHIPICLAMRSIQPNEVFDACSHFL